MRIFRTVLIGAATFFLSIGTTNAAKNEHEVTESYPISAGQKVVVDVASLKVDLRSADVVEAEISTDLRISGVEDEKALEWLKGHTPEISTNQDGLLVRLEPGQHGFLGLGHLTARARLGAVIPGTTVPDITTSSGDIHLRGDFPQARPLQLRTSTGDMEFEGAAPEIDIRSASGDSRIVTFRPFERLFLRTSSGGINLTGGARNVYVDTSSGNVWLTNLSGSSEVYTSTVKISLRWDRLDPDATVKVLTSGGKVDLLLPENANPRGFVRTTTGTIRCEFPGVVNAAGDTVELTGDGPLLEIESASGDIVIEKRSKHDS
jgi:hypothetical protein